MDATSWVGQELLDRDGRGIGRIAEVFLDDTTMKPEWAAVENAPGRSGWTFVPVREDAMREDAVRADVTEDQVRSAPDVEVVEGRLSPEDEARLYRHYETGEAGAPSTVEGPGVLGVDARTSEPRTGEEIDQTPAMIRSEEEFVVDKQLVPRERVRFAKRVVTETVTRTIEVRREELHIERIPLEAGAGETDEFTATGTPAATGAPPATGRSGSSPGGLAGRLPDPVRTGLQALQRRVRGSLSERREPFTDDTVEVELLQEEVVVSKRVVPRERVRIRRQTVTQPHDISGELRKERVDVERLGPVEASTGDEASTPDEASTGEDAR